jgi:thiosulfate/3-mercaptopyruvate sulfurtransferase
LEPWEKVLVSAADFPATVHGAVACVDCHGGTLSDDKEAAHTGLVGDPSADPQQGCGQCHPDVAAVTPGSLHSTQQGYWTVINARAGEVDSESGLAQDHPAYQQMFNNHCARCHTTCGDCHVSQPDSVGGGLLSGHVFERTPPMTRTCTACHGSRVGNEYLGKNEGYPGDVHFREGRMNCADCHTSHELHGQTGDCAACHPAGEAAAALPPPEHRYDGVQFPRCETCHAAVTAGQDGIEQHAVHGGDLSCQVCHAITYTSCDGCHVAISDKSGRPYFETEATYPTFVIGRNPRPSYQRPYAFVPVRHVPAAATGFAFYGEDLLAAFDALPTWAYATPHNIQLKTPQTETCNACHGQAALFLTADKVKPDELDANLGVIVETVPEPIVTPEP